MPLAVAFLHDPAGIYGVLVAAIVASLYAVQRLAFLPAFTGIAAALLTALGFVAVSPSLAGLSLLAVGIALLHVEFLFPTSGAAGALGLAVTAWASFLLTSGAFAPGAGPLRCAVALLGTLVLFAAIAHTMRLRTLPKN